MYLRIQSKGSEVVKLYRKGWSSKREQRIDGVAEMNLVAGVTGIGRSSYAAHRSCFLFFFWGGKEYVTNARHSHTLTRPANWICCTAPIKYLKVEKYGVQSRALPHIL